MGERAWTTWRKTDVCTCVTLHIHVSSWVYSWTAVQFSFWRACEVCDGEGEGEEEEEGHGTWYFYHDLNPTGFTKIPWCVCLISPVASDCVNLERGPNVQTNVRSSSQPSRWPETRPNSSTWCGLSISLLSLDLCESYLARCSSFQAQCRPVSRCWGVLAEGVDSPTSPRPPPRSRTFHNLMRKMAERGKTEASLEYFHNSSSSIP